MNVSVRDVVKWAVRWSILPMIALSAFLYVVSVLFSNNSCRGTGTANAFTQRRFICAEWEQAFSIVLLDCVLGSVLVLMFWLFAHQFRHTRLIWVGLLLHLFVFRLLLVVWLGKTYVIF